ncbi:MAG TPA: bifunctional diaminohydroxyphosphoribosylaminopyrimidine deaminase/5-amino-6-(5-phosphoribosylamino)uracil reductase RibD [Nakamurella sp.]
MHRDALTPAEIGALHRAADLADRGAATALPNPVVGCVLLAPGGWIVGEGYHERPGGPHAEVAALTAAGTLASGSTAVVTLEPCNHSGRTGPCSEALVAAGVARVIVAVRDPWPPAAGGIARLRAAGIDVVDLPGLASDGETVAAIVAAEDINRVWLGAMRSGRPFVTWKVGMTIDGRVAAADATSRWITSPESRSDVHALRSRIDTIIVGVGTVLADDPQLTVRDECGDQVGRQPLRVVVDSAGRTPANARVHDDAAETWFATRESAGDQDGLVDPAAVLAELWRRGKRHVLLEGGPHLAASFLDAGLVDEVLAYVAPTLLGAGPSALAGGRVATLADAHRAELVDVTRLGPDVRLRYRVSNTPAAHRGS